MVARDLALAGYEDRPVHLMHVSARESVEALGRALADGVRATAEVTPHHLCLTDEAVRTLDPNLKMNPPLRSEDDRAALVEALRDGTIGCVATDHAPHARHEKEVPFEEAPFGVTGLETAFAALHTHLVAPGLLSLEALLERMSAGPARALGLPVPSIARGSAGEPRRCSTSRRSGRSTEREFRSLSANSWLPRRHAPRQVVATIADGRRPGDRYRRGCPRLQEARHERLPAARGRHGVRGPLGGRRRDRVRRGRLHDRDDRLPGDGHRSELRGAARLLHGADGRELRRRRRAPRVGAAARDRRADAAARRRGVGRLAARSRHRRARRDRHARADAAVCARRARCAPRRSPTRTGSPVDEALAQVRAQPTMEGPALVAQVSTSEPYVGGRGGARARRRSSTTAPSARSCGGCGCGRGGDRLPARRRPRRARAASTASCSRTARATRSRSSRRRTSSAGCSAACRCSGSASGTSCSASRPATSTFKLPVRPPRRQPPGARARAPAACSSRARTTASRSRRAESDEATHVSLYDGTVEGFDFRELRARLGAVPSRGRARARTTPGRSSSAGSRAWSRADAGARRPPLDLRDRLRPDRDRAGVRVRLRGLPGAEGAARGRLPDDRRQLEPGDDHDRPGLRRPHLHRAARRRRRRRRAASASGPTRCCRRSAGQTALNLADRARRGRRARRARRRAASAPAST